MVAGPPQTDPASDPADAPAPESSPDQLADQPADRPGDDLAPIEGPTRPPPEPEPAPAPTPEPPPSPTIAPGNPDIDPTLPSDPMPPSPDSGGRQIEPPTFEPGPLLDADARRDPDARLDPEAYDPEQFEYEPTPREWEEMPYAATEARKSATQRNNDVLVRPFNKPIYSIAAAGRFATSLIGAREVIKPFGFGVGAQLRIHFLRVFKSRLGVEVYAGYTRFSQRINYPAVEGGEIKITRLNLLAHTDISAGPSMQIPIGPVFLQFGGSGGIAFSTLTRTQSIEAIQDELVISTDFLLRGGLSLGVPILNRHGLTLGGAVLHVFSRDEVPTSLADPDGPQSQPFGTWLEINLGYQMWF